MCAAQTIIPYSELHFSFARSGGPGGQNVNKTATKALVRWSLWNSSALSTAQKARVAAKLANRLNKAGELIVTSEAERSQTQNRERAVAQLNALVLQALKIKPARHPTRPTRTAKEKRLSTKKLRGKIKQTRRVSALFLE